MVIDLETTVALAVAVVASLVWLVMHVKQWRRKRKC